MKGGSRAKQNKIKIKTYPIRWRYILENQMPKMRVIFEPFIVILRFKPFIPAGKRAKHVEIQEFNVQKANEDEQEMNLKKKTKRGRRKNR
jgi:hypothetical protein